jgi:hypothetical protein
LDCAKSYDWIELAAALEWDPTLVNAHPCGRWSALHQAVWGREKAVVEWLLYAKADPTCKDAEGRQPSALTDDKEIVNLLKAAAEGRFSPAVAPPTPTKVGGYLPHIYGGSIDDYYWPSDRYSYQQTFRGGDGAPVRGAAASASSSMQ